MGCFRSSVISNRNYSFLGKVVSNMHLRFQVIIINLEMQLRNKAIQNVSAGKC